MTVDLSVSYAHCEAELKSQDHDSWLATLFAPAGARPQLHAVGAFVLEIGHVRGRVRQPIAGEIRLQWWQDVIDGDRSSEAAAHPVAAALVDTIGRAHLPRAVVGDMIDAFRIALYDEPPASVAAYEGRLVALRGTPVRLAAEVLGETGEPVAAAASDAGIALAIADLVRDLPRRSGHHTVPLPDEMFSANDATRSDFDAGRLTPGVDRVLVELRAMARARLAALRSRRQRLGRAGPAFLTASLAEPRLKRGEGRDPFAVAPDLPQWRRQWRIWRAARNGGVT